MLDLNRTMFYKTEFDILAPKGQDALWSVVLKIRGWIADKARRSSYRFPCDNATWTSLKNGTRAKAEGADVEMYSSLHIEEGVYTWACRFAENVDLKDGSAPRQWLTEVGFKGRSLEEGTFSLVLSYSDRAGFIGPLQAVPGRSIPKLVDYLLKDDALDCTVSGINVKSGPVEVGSENGDARHHREHRPRHTRRVRQPGHSRATARRPARTPPGAGTERVGVLRNGPPSSRGNEQPARAPTPCLLRWRGPCLRNAATRRRAP